MPRGSRQDLLQAPHRRPDPITSTRPRGLQGIVVGLPGAFQGHATAPSPGLRGGSPPRSSGASTAVAGTLVSPVDRLHPVLPHHVVNTLGWPGLRPLQQAAIDPLLGRGGCAAAYAQQERAKTEAAVFPLLSAMVTQPWSGPSVLYGCPLKALANNLE
jgi:hypothetical protein